jgi:hypothetical protein
MLLLHVLLALVHGASQVQDLEQPLSARLMGREGGEMLQAKLAYPPVWFLAAVVPHVADAWSAL